LATLVGYCNYIIVQGTEEKLSSSLQQVVIGFFTGCQSCLYLYFSADVFNYIKKFGKTTKNFFASGQVVASNEDSEDNDLIEIRITDKFN
jgi:hypothetical protein